MVTVEVMTDLVKTKYQDLIKWRQEKYVPCADREHGVRLHDLPKHSGPEPNPDFLIIGYYFSIGGEKQEEDICCARESPPQCQVY